MSGFAIGEFDVSPPSIRKLLSKRVMGARYVLLDSVRDAAFLSPSGNDFGLGVVDNGLFFYTTRFVPGSSPAQPRQFPTKFFWIGSPLGTNDKNDTFNLYVADVNESTFYPGAPASVWLVNPRLVLSPTQAKTDIVAWFDANYPGGGTNGVGNGNAGSNSQYGTLGGGTSAVGNVSGVNSLDGQFWPIYDYVDNSVLLYFSVKTPNGNTLSIYTYKLADTEFGAPATSSQFVGGVVSNVNNGVATVLSSHRFSTLSPDPLVAQGFTPGQQTAVVFLAYGIFDGSTPDHGKYVAAFLLKDIHGSPLNWVSRVGETTRVGADTASYPVDKLGAIQALTSGNSPQASYSCLYNAPSDRDLRAGGSNKVVISAMQIRVLYYHPGAGTVTFGNEPIIPAGGLNAVGHCRPQFTFLPDGLPKIITATFSFDQYLNIGYEYFEKDTLQPEKQKVLSVSYDGFPIPLILPTYGKRRMRLIISPSFFGGQGIPSPNPQNIKTVAQIAEAYALDSSEGFYANVYYDAGTLLLNTQNSPYGYDGKVGFQQILEVELDGLPPYIRLQSLGTSVFRYLQGVIEMSD